MKNKFDIGDLVKHKTRNYFGVILKVMKPTLEEGVWLYKVAWQQGHWMFELESQLKLEQKANGKHTL